MTKRILCIDGGGVRGAAAIAFLDKLDQALVATGSSLRDRFDMFVGTSSGAMIIAGLIYGGLTPEEIKDKFFSYRVCKQVFPPSTRDDVFGVMQLRPKYDGKGKRTLLERHLPPHTRLNDTIKDVAITGYDVDRQECLVMRNWHREYAHMLARDAVDISTAAPAYFPLVRSSSTGQHIRGIDGGVFANNPTDIAYSLALQRYGPDTDIRVLSVGTGLHQEHEPDTEAKIPDNSGGIQWMVEGRLMNIVYDAPQNQVHNRMEMFTSALGHRYIRVNGPVTSTGIDNVERANLIALKATGVSWWEEHGADAWKTLFLPEEEEEQ